MKRALPWLVLAAVIAFVAWKLHGSHFDYAGAWAAIRTANPWLLAAAILVIYSNCILRALRWSLFLRADGGPAVPWTRLAGSQFIGFTGLALFGRIGELIRPLLVARRAQRTFASQIAVVTVERVFDLAAFGTLFAVTLLSSPTLRALPFIGQAGKVIGGLTVVLFLFVALVLLAGDTVARLAAKLSPTVAEKVLTFRDGLRVIRGSFLPVAAISLGLWASVVTAYWLVFHAFPAPVSNLGLGAAVVITGFSIAGSALPVPSGSGSWAGISFALARLFHVPDTIAIPAGLLVWAVGTLAIIPAGLLFARTEGISLTGLLGKSEAEA
jgi:uncharacterized protein (TIRG00374 family)